MSFGVALALLVGLLVAAPVVAHLLRRGKTVEQEFPPTPLVPAFVITSQQRHRLEDRALLLLRALMVLALAVLGATPFVRCSDLSVERASGASVALAIVVDDSQSMRGQLSSGESRFEVARRGAEQLLGSAREGDTIALISGGHPAQLILNATSDLRAASEALQELRVSDRGTDLGEAVALARAALRDLPHVDKRVILLSDLAVRDLPRGEPVPWTPLPELREPIHNCGVALAQLESKGVLATVGCNSPEAARDRKLEVFVTEEAGREPLAAVNLQALQGIQKLDVKVDGLGLQLSVRLSGQDAIAADDSAGVSEVTSELTVAVAADPAKASTITGGPTVLVQALNALDPKLDVRPLGELPEAAGDLERYGALIVDDPPGLSPEERNALGQWLMRGGAVLGLLGPASGSAQLASSIEPFAREGVTWEGQSPVGIKPESVGWLGDEGASLASLAGSGRVRLDAADLPDTLVRGRWEDGVPWLFQREVGRGVVWTVGSPASVELGDLALRPGFLALLDLVVEHGRQTRGPKRSQAGTPWWFAEDTALTVTGPDGPLRSELITLGETQKLRVIPTVAGRYEVQTDQAKETRQVTVDTEELTLMPLAAETIEQAIDPGASDNLVDASPEWALLLLALFAIEMVWRAFGEQLRQRLARGR